MHGHAVLGEFQYALKGLLANVTGHSLCGSAIDAGMRDVLGNLLGGWWGHRLGHIRGSC